MCVCDMCVCVRACVCVRVLACNAVCWRIFHMRGCFFGGIDEGTETNQSASERKGKASNRDKLLSDYTLWHVESATMVSTTSDGVFLSHWLSGKCSCTANVLLARGWTVRIPPATAAFAVFTQPLIS